MTNATRLRIGIDAQGGSQWPGGLELTKNLVVASGLHCLEQNIDVEFQIFGSEDQNFENVLPDRIRSMVHWNRRPRYRLSLAQRIGLRLGIHPVEKDLSRLVKKLDLDFLYPCPYAPSAMGCRSAAWIADFQHRYLPDLLTTSELELKEKRFSYLIESADRVVLSSLASKDDFETFYPAHAGKARTLPFRVFIEPTWLDPPSEIIIKKYRLPSKFFIVSNQFWAHKNHGTVIKAVAKLTEQIPDLTVVMTGNLSDYRNPGYPNQLISEIQESGVHSNIRLLGMIPKKDQIQLLQASTAVIQPSSFEGWSTIVEECHAIGVPIILSDLKVHKEQAPPSCRYFRCGDFNDLAEAMKEYWKSTDAQGFSDSYIDRFKLFGGQFVDIATS